MAEMVDTSSARPKVQSVAVPFMALIGASANFEVSMMVNGLVETRKTYSFDAFAPGVQIADLNSTMKAEDGRLTVTSLEQPNQGSMHFVRIAAGICKSDIRVCAQAERVSLAAEAVVDAPTVRAALHEQLQIQAIAVGQLCTSIAGLTA